MNSADSFEKLRNLITDVHVCMLTTAVAGGALRSRPLTTLESILDERLCFFIGTGGAMAEELRINPQINLSYSEPTRDRYVSVSGSAEIVRDPVKIRELWKPNLKSWFPLGLADPELALLRVDVEAVEYWDAASSKFVKIIGFLKELTLGEHFQKLGGHQELH